MFVRLILSTVITLGASNMAWADDIQDLEHAEALIQAGDWAEAVPVLDRLVASNPQHGGYRHYRAYAQAESGACTEAVEDFAVALEYGSFGRGGWMRHAFVEGAACAAQIGQAELAMDWLTEAQGQYGADIAELTRDETAFDSLRDRPDFRRLTGVVETDLSRDAGWRYDLGWFVELVERRHPDPFHTVSEVEWRRAVASLDQAIPSLTDLEVVAGFMRLAALIEDGHTSVYPPFEGAMAFHVLPIWPYQLDGRWTILAAGPGYEHLVGAEITAIEGVPIDAAMHVIDDHMTEDHAGTIRWIGSIALQLSDIGASFFGAAHADRLALTLTMTDGEVTDLVLPGVPINRNIASRWAPPGWAALGDDPAPLWLTGLDRTFRLTDLPALDAVYAQINQIRNAEDETYEAFATRIMARMDAQDATRLVLDLRHNNGGNGNLNQSLLHAIIRSDRLQEDGSLFVITGRRTFSAAQLLINDLETHTGAIFVGEESSSSPAFYGEDTEFTLPVSGLRGSISSRWFQNRMMHDDERPFIPVDLPALLTREALEAGRDPALEAISAHLAAR